MSSGRFNWPLWCGALLAPIAFVSFPLLFVRWSVTREFPWVNVLGFVVAASLLARGVRQAFSSGRYQWLRVAVSLVLVGVSGVMLSQFVVMAFIAPRQLPASLNAPNVGQRAPDFTLPDDSDLPQSLEGLLRAPISDVATGAKSTPRAVLLIFYMHSGCRACNIEFRDIEHHLPAFRAAGVLLVAISIDPPDVSRTLSREAGYSFMFLSDPTLQVIRQYDLAKPDGEARPAEFLVDREGIVRWRNLTTNYYVRATPAQVLAEANKLQ